jgi:hypothetical protein
MIDLYCLIYMFQYNSNLIHEYEVSSLSAIPIPTLKKIYFEDVNK